MLVHAVQPGGTTEVSLPESTYLVDLFLVADPASEAWGVLRDDLRDRAVVFEHFSRPPSPQQLATAVMKTAWGLVRWLDERQPSRHPVGVVLCVGEPVGALGFLRLLRRTRLPGVYRTRDSALELILVDVTRLSRGPGRSFLRLFDHRSRVSGQNLRDLQTDPTLSRLTRDSILEAIMRNPASFTPPERAITADALRAEMALELATRALTVRLGDPLPADLRRALKACSESSVLGQLVELAVRSHELAEDQLRARALEVLRGDVRNRGGSTGPARRRRSARGAAKQTKSRR